MPEEETTPPPPTPTDTVVPYTAPSIGEGILTVERWSRAVHNHQRLAALDALKVPERVAHLMRDVNRSLSAPDKDRDLAFGRRAHELLRNAAVKSQFASFLALEGLIHRLASLTVSQGIIDETLSNEQVLSQLDFNQLIALQRSQHVQKMEILQFMDKKKFDGLHAVVNALASGGEEEAVKVGLTDLGKLKPGSRERVGKLLNKLITTLAAKPDIDGRVTRALTNIDADAETSENGENET
jgi:hypothetical protein